jgi:hypothetical protein
MQQQTHGVARSMPCCTVTQWWAGTGPAAYPGLTVLGSMPCCITLVGVWAEPRCWRTCLARAAHALLLGTCLIAGMPHPFVRTRTTSASRTDWKSCAIALPTDILPRLVPDMHVQRLGPHDVLAVHNATSPSVMFVWDVHVRQLGPRNAPRCAPLCTPQWCVGWDGHLQQRAARRSLCARCALRWWTYTTMLKLPCAVTHAQHRD